MRRHFPAEAIDIAIETATCNLIVAPPGMQDLIVSHMREMWRLLAPEWIDEAIREEIRKEMLRAIAQRRLVAQALAARGRPARFYSASLVQMGRWLEAWGRRLQARYGALAEATIATPGGDRMTGC